MKDNGSNACVTEEVMAKDKKKPVQQDEKMPAEAHETVEQNSAENRAENSEDNGGVTLSKDEFERAKAEVERMNAEIETLKKSADEAIGDAQRIQAEFNNFRKRNASVRAESYDDGIRETIKNILPVLDNFERALATSDGSPFSKGMEQIQKQLLDCLKKSGLEEIEAEGVFDPNMHDAVMRDEDDSDAESGTITAVLQKGYRVKGKIIRHTMVKVKA